MASGGSPARGRSGAGTRRKGGAAKKSAEGEANPSPVADAREIMAYYTSVMRGEVTENVPLFVGQGVQEFTVNRPKISDRTAAAEKLAKLMGADKSPEAQIAPRIIDVRPED